MDSTTVAIIPCRDYAPCHVDVALGELFSHFGGSQNIIKPGQRVLLKPNLVDHNQAREGGTTHPHILEAVIKIVKACNAYPFIGDSPAFGSTRGVARTSGIEAVARHYDVPIVTFKSNKNIHRNKSDTEYLIGQLSPEIRKKVIRLSTISASVQEFDSIINIPKLKTHSQMVFTGAVKNLYGFVSGKAKPLRHFFVHNDIELFSLALLYIYERIRPDFTIVDGIEVWEKREYHTRVISKRGIICGGIDCVTIDTVIGYLIHKSIQDVPFLKYAHQYKIGETNLDLIHLVGDTDIKIENFLTPSNLMPIGFSFETILRSICRQALILFKEKI